MRSLHKVVLLGLVLWCGCGAGVQRAPVSNAADVPVSAPPSQAYAPPETALQSAEADSEGPRPASSADHTFSVEGEALSEESAQSAPDPRVRPGLATEWGETRRSYVRQESFARAGDSPFAEVGIHYNDYTGVAYQATHRQAREGNVQFFSAYGDGIRIAIVDQNGSPLPGRMVNGTAYVIGQPGQAYAIELTNTTSGRFEAVVSVDGLDAINGSPASYGYRGYLLLPYGTLRIEGWRQSTSTVAAFRFGSVADSYAGRTGDARNVGVIGVAMFAEAGWDPQPVHTYDQEIELRESADPFPTRFAPPPPRPGYVL